MKIIRLFHQSKKIKAQNNSKKIAEARILSIRIPKTKNLQKKIPTQIILSPYFLKEIMNYDGIYHESLFTFLCWLISNNGMYQFDSDFYVTEYKLFY